MGSEGNIRVSSSYSDLIVNIDVHIVTIKGSARIEVVVSCIETIDNIFSCNICRFASQEKVNTVAHVVYIHRPQPETADMLTHQNDCRPSGSYDLQPSSTQPNPLTISSWYNFLGSFTPTEAVNPAVD